MAGRGMMHFLLQVLLVCAIPCVPADGVGAERLRGGVGPLVLTGPPDAASIMTSCMMLFFVASFHQKAGMIIDYI